MNLQTWGKIQKTRIFTLTFLIENFNFRLSVVNSDHQFKSKCLLAIKHLTLT